MSDFDPNPSEERNEEPVDKPCRVTIEIGHDITQRERRVWGSDNVAMALADCIGDANLPRPARLVAQVVRDLFEDGRIAFPDELPTDEIWLAIDKAEMAFKDAAYGVMEAWEARDKVTHSYRSQVP